MIVDDDSLVRQVICQLLAEGNYEFIEAGNADQALEHFKREYKKFDLVLLDMMLPEMNGMALFKRLQEIKPNVAAIMITAHGSLPLAVEFMKLGGADFVEKPLDAEIMLIKIKRVLAKLELQRKLRNAEINRRAAEVANRLKNEFLANVSHDLRAPMSGILSFSMFAIDRIKKFDKDKLLEYFKKIRDSGERLLIMVDNLLDISILEEGRVKYVFKKGNLSNFVKTALNDLEALAKEKKITLRFVEPPFKVNAVLDKVRIIQVITNLVSNAIKFSSAKSTIKIEFEDKGEYFILSVTDKGVGIPKDELERIFDKFVQSRKAKSSLAGTGLGLAICKQIMLDHGGNIWAEQNPKGGSVFRILLPKRAKRRKVSNK